MDRASALPFPSSRTLAGWWRSLDAAAPAGLAVGYAYLHRVEALVRTARPRLLSPLDLHLLRAVALEPATPPPCQRADCVGRLQARLHLPAAALRATLPALARADLVAASAEHGWTLTDRGRAALARQADVAAQEERRSFPFVEQVDPAGRRVAPPFFLPIAACPAEPWDVADDERFDPMLLRQCVTEAADWKRAAGFPDDVVHVEDDAAAAVEGVAGAAALPWQRVVLDRTERVFLALVRTTAEWLGFAARPDDWTLFTDEPVLRLSAAPWPELGAEPDSAVLADAWRGWCRPRNLPAADVEACTVAWAADRVVVAAPDRLVQRLHADRSDLVRGGTWLLLGDGHLRRAAAVELRASGAAV